MVVIACTVRRITGVASRVHATFTGVTSRSHATFTGVTSRAHPTVTGVTSRAHPTFTGVTSRAHPTVTGVTSRAHATLASRRHPTRCFVSGRRSSHGIQGYPLRWNFKLGESDVITRWSVSGVSTESARGEGHDGDAGGSTKLGSEAPDVGESHQNTKSSPNVADEDLGDNDLVDTVLRVDLAGELAADRIYAGQMAVLANTSASETIQHMWDQEKHHLATMRRLVAEHKCRPSALMPVWAVAGYALGAGSALLGQEAAMACTAAVEEVIGEHYNDQIRSLMADDAVKHAELLKIIKQFRDEELEHLETGLEHGAERAPLYEAMTTAIKLGCRAAIFVAERV